MDAAEALRTARSELDWANKSLDLCEESLVAAKSLVRRRQGEVDYWTEVLARTKDLTPPS